MSRFVHGSNANRTNPDSLTLSHLAMSWCQLVDHDVTLAEAQGLNCKTENHNPECINLNISSDDITFRSREVDFIELERDAPHKPAAKCKLIPREQSNSITAFLDASTVYGSSGEEEKSLRAPGGLMRVMKHPDGCRLGNLLPAAHDDVPCVSKDPNRPCFLAGDERVNENQGNNMLSHDFECNCDKSARVNFSKANQIARARRVSAGFSAFTSADLSKIARGKSYDYFLIIHIQTFHTASGCFRSLTFLIPS